MRKVLLALMSMLTLCHGDSIYFKNGAKVEGEILKKDTTTVTIKVNKETTTYSMDDIERIVSTTISAPPPPPVSKGNTSLSVLPQGTVIHTMTNSVLSTQTHKAGHQFKFLLENDIVIDGHVIAKKGSDVYGTVIESKQAGRLAGKSSMIIQLTALTVENQRLAIQTNQINAVNESTQGKNTVGKLARGAAIGGLANGSSGAKNGAKVGAGAAVLTRGQATGIPAGTLLDFTLVNDVTLTP